MADDNIERTREEYIESVRTYFYAAEDVHGRKKERHIIPATKFTEFIAFNQEALHARPDPLRNAVTWNEEALEQLRIDVEQSDPLLQSVLPKDWPSLSQLWSAFMKVRMYVSMDELLTQLCHVVRTVAQQIQKMRAMNPNNLVLLALPNNEVAKSHLWLIAQCWSSVPELRQVVDFIVPSLNLTLDDMLNQLDSQWSVSILYVDDMTYSGSQFREFLQVPNRLCNRINTIFPCPGYSTTRALDYGGDKTIVISEAITFVRTPADVLLLSLRLDEGIQRDWRNLANLFTSTRQQTLVKSLHDVLNFNGTLSDAILQALRLYARFTVVDRPIILFEHKMADYVSIPHAFLRTGHDDCLVRIGGQVATGPLFPRIGNGSIAFYKDLLWYGTPKKKKKPILNTTTIRTALFQLEQQQQPFHHPLSHCGSCKTIQFLPLACPDCHMIRFCSNACQQENERTNLHAIACLHLQAFFYGTKGFNLDTDEQKSGFTTFEQLLKRMGYEQRKETFKNVATLCDYLLQVIHDYMPTLDLTLVDTREWHASVQQDLLDHAGDDPLLANAAMLQLWRNLPSRVSAMIQTMSETPATLPPWQPHSSRVKSFTDADRSRLSLLPSELQLMLIHELPAFSILALLDARTGLADTTRKEALLLLMERDFFIPVTKNRLPLEGSSVILPAIAVHVQERSQLKQKSYFDILDFYNNLASAIGNVLIGVVTEPYRLREVDQPLLSHLSLALSLSGHYFGIDLRQNRNGKSGAWMCHTDVDRRVSKILPASLARAIVRFSSQSNHAAMRSRPVIRSGPFQELIQCVVREMDLSVCWFITLNKHILWPRTLFQGVRKRVGDIIVGPETGYRCESTIMDITGQRTFWLVDERLPGDDPALFE